MSLDEKKNPTLVFYKSKKHCEYCDFTTSNSRDFTRHLATRKHKKNFLQISKNGQSPPKSSEQKASKIKKNQQQTSLLEKICPSDEKFFTNKKTPKFSCEHCRREFTYYSWLCRHYTSCKMKNKITNKKTPYHCALCNKDFTYKKSFSKHYVRCEEIHSSKINNKSTNNDTDNESKIIEMLVESNKTNKELCEKVLKLESEKQHIIQQNITTNQYQNNNQLNINLFLNEDCKNAMNITDFVNQIQLSLDDLQYTKDNGFVNGISNIFIKNLEDLEPTVRPIHYNNPTLNTSNTKKSNKPEFYIKDKDTWAIDNKNEKLNATIDSVSKKQTVQIKEWEKENPNWNESESGIDEYMQMISIVMGGLNIQERNKNKDLIKARLTESIEINAQGKLKDT